MLHVVTVNGLLRILIGAKELWFPVETVGWTTHDFPSTLSFDKAFLAFSLRWKMSIPFNQGFLLETFFFWANEFFDVCLFDGLLKHGLIGTVLDFGLDFRTLGTNETFGSLLMMISSSHSLSMVYGYSLTDVGCTSWLPVWNLVEMWGH